MAFLQVLITIVIIIIALVALYSLFRKSPEKYYKLALKAHKRGELSYGSGNDESASKYYEEAEKYRRKAEELKNVV